ncbi:MAG: hypothetical protein WDM91_04280 [Rhizomicrobium sp.]
MQASWKSFVRPVAWTGGALALVLAVGIAVTQMAESAQPVKRNIPPGKAVQREASAPTPAPAPCNGNFSDGSKINVANPVYLQDVPGDQLFCDFHTFAWNQFIYLVQPTPDPQTPGQSAPRFLQMAPWYNLLKPNNPKNPPSAYPGGSTALEGAHLDQGQAGDDDHLLDVKGALVQYDIRFNAQMYNAILQANTYTQAGYNAACKPGPQPNQTCANPIWLPPTAANPGGQPPAPGAMEIKTAWRDFGSPANCPAAQFYCDGRFGLVGMHIVQKTQTHGEWIWASFEHVANDPDCLPQGDTPIAAQSPLGTSWSFFNPATAGQGVMTSQICEVSGTSPQCNANPKYYLTQKLFIYKPVNICRTDYLPPGGASTVNCTTIPDGPPESASNSGGNVACLNATFMPQMTGVWQNYKMIGSLWVRGTLAPTQDFRVQIFQTQQPGLPYGEPVGFPHLANTMMETWMQSGSTGYDPFGDNATQAGCFNCHNLPSSSFGADLSHFPDKLPQSVLAKRIKELLPADSTTVVTEHPMAVTALQPANPHRPAKKK